MVVSVVGVNINELPVDFEICSVTLVDGKAI